MPRLLLVLLPLCAPAIGCGSEPPVAAGTTPGMSSAAGDKPADFQPSACGTIMGSVTWTGPIPTVPPVIDIRPRPDGTGHDTRTFPHPYAPAIDRATYALTGAAVFLRNADPTRAKPWDLPPVSVEFRDAQIRITQGDRPPGRVGFVKRGAPVRFQSADPTFNVLRGRGAAFFALPFPDPDKPLERAFDTPGRVALTSAAGFHWQAADLFVADHPYYTLSGADGRFELTQVPEGTYELVAWHPNWNTTGHERNPETGLVQRVTYAPALESVRSVVVTPGRAAFAPLNLSLPK